MKRIKTILVKMMIVVTLAVVFHPTLALAEGDPGGPQGTTNSQPTPPPPPPIPLWLLLLFGLRMGG